MAQLGARLHGMQKVASSSLAGSILQSILLVFNHLCWLRINPELGKAITPRCIQTVNRSWQFESAF